MNLTKTQSITPEPTITLESLSAGQTFRYAHMTFDDAVSKGAFYMVVSALDIKVLEKQRISVVHLTDGLLMQRDGDHRVVQHNSEIVVSLTA